jgi:hypothetical protein
MIIVSSRRGFVVLVLDGVSSDGSGSHGAPSRLWKNRPGTFLARFPTFPEYGGRF